MAGAAYRVEYDRHWIVLVTLRRVQGEEREFRARYTRADLPQVIPLLQAELDRPPRPEEADTRRPAGPPGRGRVRGR